MTNKTQPSKEVGYASAEIEKYKNTAITRNRDFVDIIINGSTEFLSGYNEITLSEIFIELCNDQVIYNNSDQEWLAFKDGMWCSAEQAESLVVAHYKMMLIYLDGEFKQKVNAREYLKANSWLDNAMNYSKQKSILNLVKVRLAKNMNDLDSNHELIGIRDMVFDISTHSIRNATGSDLVFKSIGTTYDQDAKCPHWENFLKTTMQGDLEMMDYLRRLTGYFLTASIQEQEIYYFYGTGANGKSTFLDIVKTLLGDYAKKIPSDSIMQNNLGERSNATMANLAKLSGARLAITDEVSDHNNSFNTQTLKSISGDDELSARKLYRNPIEFKSTAKVVMYGNDKPYGNINDEGFWRRFRFIHFAYTVPEKQRDKHLLTKLKDELPGILNWALEGLRDWRTNGLSTPQKIIDDCVEYRKELDNIQEFLDLNIAVESDCKTSSKDLFESYFSWCLANLLNSEKKETFSRRVKVYFSKLNGVSPYRTSKSRGYQGVRLKTQNE